MILATIARIVGISNCSKKSPMSDADCGRFLVAAAAVDWIRDPTQRGATLRKRGRNASIVSPISQIAIPFGHWAAMSELQIGPARRRRLGHGSRRSRMGVASRGMPSSLRPLRCDDAAERARSAEGGRTRVRSAPTDDPGAGWQFVPARAGWSSLRSAGVRSRPSPGDEPRSESRGDEARAGEPRCGVSRVPRRRASWMIVCAVDSTK